jgi:DNA polymerase III subunit delta'
MARFATRGHAAALAVVRRAIESERPPHALLVSGPAEVGKTTLALDLAAGLLCAAERSSERPCGVCTACRRVASGNHPDLHRLAPEGAGGQIRLGQVQALAVELSLLPLEGRFRVAVVEQAQRLNLDAQHALLKTLEEPPARVVIVLAADEPSGLLPTVVSRCARLRLGTVNEGVIAEMLVEQGVADAMRGTSLARLSGGRPGIAAELAVAPERVVARDALARRLLDLLGADRHARLGEQLARGAEASSTMSGAPPTDDSAEPATRAARGMKASPAERRAAVSQLLAVWRDVARDLAICAVGGAAAIRGIELLDDLRAAAARVDPAAVTAFVDRLDSLARAIDAYANPELVLDVLLLDWPRLAPGAGVARLDERWLDATGTLADFRIRAGGHGGD